MTKRPPKELIWLSIVLLTAYAILVVWLSLSHGVNHRSNDHMMSGFLAAIGGVICAASGVASLLWTVIDFRVSSIRWRVFGLAVGMLAIVCPWPLLTAYTGLATLRERYDFQHAGPSALRQAAADLIRSAATLDYPPRYFGGEVPRDDVPRAIQTFIPGAGYVTVTDQEVVIVTDGMGGWRGGYSIVPSGSSFVPNSSRRIDDGFYYVVTNN